MRQIGAIYALAILLGYSRRKGNGKNTQSASDIKKTDYNIADPAWLLFFLAIVSGFSYTCLHVEGIVAFLFRH